MVTVNSRKEPSALNKKSPSPSKPEGNLFSPTTTEKKSLKSTSFGQGAGNTPSSSSKKSATPVDKKDHFDVLLSGKDYWGLDNSIVDDIRSEVNNKGSGLPSSSAYPAYPTVHEGEEDPLSFTSKLHLNEEDIYRRKQSMEDDLAEFERLETAASSATSHHPNNKPSSEYHLAKTLEPNISSKPSSYLSKQASNNGSNNTMNASVSHSRLLAQTLARTNSNTMNASSSSSKFGYKRDAEDDEEEEEDIETMRRRLSEPNNKIANHHTLTTSIRPTPMTTRRQSHDEDEDHHDDGDGYYRYPDKMSTKHDDDNDYDENAATVNRNRPLSGNLNNPHHHSSAFPATVANVEDEHVDLSFNFDDLPLPTVAPPTYKQTSSSINNANNANNHTQNHQNKNQNSNLSSTMNRLERPSSTLKVDQQSSSASVNSRQSRSKTLTSHSSANNHTAKRASSLGRRGPETSASNNSSSSVHDGGMTKEMEEKMRSLEKELEHYR